MRFVKSERKIAIKTFEKSKKVRRGVEPPTTPSGKFHDIS